MIDDGTMRTPVVLTAEQVWEAMRVSCDHLDRTVRGACQICCYEGLGTAPSCAFSTCPLLKEGHAASAWNSRPREERLEGLLREARSLLPPHHDLKLKIDAALKDEGKE